MCSHTPTIHPRFISWFPWIFSLAPQFFFQHDSSSKSCQVPVGNQVPVGEWSVLWVHRDSWLKAKKIEGPRKKSRNSRWSHGDKGQIFAQSWNQKQTLKEYFCFYIYCTHLGTPRYRIVGDICTVPNRESRYPRRETEDRRDTSLPWKGNSRSYQILKK